MIVRPPKPSDYPAILEVVGSAAQHDWTHRADERAIYNATLNETSSVIVIAHRQVVGFARWDLEDAEEGQQMSFEGWVMPMARRAEVGEALFIAAERAAAEAGAVAIAAANYDSIPGFAPLAATRGFKEARRFNQMWKRLPDDALPSPLQRPLQLQWQPQTESTELTEPTDQAHTDWSAIAPGFHIEPYAEHWNQALAEAEDEAFAEHWGVSPWRNNGARIQQRIRTIESYPQGFDPALFLLACTDEGKIAAFTLAQPSPLDGPESDAWVWHVGTRPAYRGRGLARELLKTMMGRLSLRYDRVGLHVDSQNVPAVALYNSLGFQTLRQRIHIQKSIRAWVDEP